MSAELINDWYISADQYDVGPSSGTATDRQINNANIIAVAFLALGWSLTAVAGMIGNMMYESCICPACVYPKSSFPNGGAALADLDNSYAINITNSAYGLVQWFGTTTTPPAGNQLVSYAIRHNSQWYEGQIQIDRLTWEYQDDEKWHTYTIDGTAWTWSNYATDENITPEKAAHIFMRCYEDTYSVLEIRQANARYWYDYFIQNPPHLPFRLDHWLLFAFNKKGNILKNRKVIN